MPVGTIVFLSIVGAFVVFAVVVQVRAWRRDRIVKRGERRGGPVDLRRGARAQQNEWTAQERTRVGLNNNLPGSL